jgi:hypothetical protein
LILCSRWIWLWALLALLFQPHAYGVNINAVYYASCQREVGVIVHVDEDSIAILSLTGKIKKIARFDIIYLAYYPIGEIPIDQVSNGDEIDGVTIKTLYDNEVVDLVKGWPVDFTDDKISFISLDGQETVMDRDSIWSVKVAPFAKSQKFKKAARKSYSFVHPYPFVSCPVTDGGGNARRVFPQQLLGDRLIIRNELDRLMAGYEQMVDYADDQRFYPVPQVYNNRTSLGLWYNFGSRHGKSGSRTNDLVPAVTSALSEGPFGFQRLLITGSAPLPFSVHEEPQTQFYYRLKADYVHFSYFYDIDRLLIGEEPYKWKIEDLDKYDDRVNEVHHLAGGFDYGNYAVGLTFSMLQYGVRHEDSFFVHRAEMNVWDISYEDRFIHTQLFIGRVSDSKGTGLEEGEDEKEPDEDEPPEVTAAREAAEAEEALKPDFTGEFQYLRFNIQLKTVFLEPQISIIYRDLKLYVEENQNLEHELTYASKSVTTVVYMNYKIDADIKMSGYISVEAQHNRSSISYYLEEHSINYPKFGVNWSLTF